MKQLIATGYLQFSAVADAWVLTTEPGGNVPVAVFCVQEPIKMPEALLRQRHEKRVEIFIQQEV
jgi:hypothetical protein